jgi:polo-like kinase 1
VHSVREAETGRTFAVKCVDKRAISPTDCAKVHEEARIMAELKHHPHLVSLVRVCEDDSFTYLLLERCRKRTLADVHKARGPLHPPEVASILLQITRALSFMHSRLVMHRDLKLSNIFFSSDNGDVKVGDFGLACQLVSAHERKRHVLGTPNYIAPDVLTGKQGEGHGLEADVWALGVIAYVTLVGYAPFQSEDVSTTHERIKRNDWCFPQPPSPDPPESAKELILACLQTEPRRRPKASTLLKHAFFAEGTEQPQANQPLGQNEMPTKSKPLAHHRHAKADTHDASAADDDKENTPLLSDATPQVATPSRDAKSDTNDIAAAIAPETATDVDDRYCDSVHDRATTLEDRLPCDFPRLWVSRWLDLTSKYGLGYLLSNGTVGACFNDGTRATLDPVSGTIEHHKRVRSSSRHHGQHRGMQRLAYGALPADASRSLVKKVKLLHHFKSHLVDAPGASKRIELAGAGELDTQARQCVSCEGRMSAVRAWYRTESATVFRLSTRSIHVAFNDSSEIILASECDAVVYRPAQAEEARAHAALQVHMLSALSSEKARQGKQELLERLQKAKALLVDTMGEGRPTLIR